MDQTIMEKTRFLIKNSMFGVFIFLGIIMIYAITHFVAISFTKTYKNRSGYEKFITIFVIISILLVILGE